MANYISKNTLLLLSLSANYSVFFPIARLLKSRYPYLTTNTTNICIEGFPRSGNSFFVAIFSRWNPRTSIAHHSHLAGSAKCAIRRGVPTIVIVRDPIDAVSSAIAWDGKLSVSVALLAYVHFYETLWTRRDKFLTLEFNQVISNASESIEKLNQRFDTNFLLNQMSEEEINLTKKQLINHDAHSGRSKVNSTLPNVTKSRIKEEARKKIIQNRLLPHAERLFQQYKSLSHQPL